MKIPKLRWVIAFLLCLSTTINYLDRLAIGVVSVEIRHEFSLNEQDYSYILSFFFFAYAVMYAGSGYIIDRLGTRRKISEMVMTGHMTFYDDLCEESLPEDVRDLMRVPHIGPRTALRLAGQLDIHSVPQLLQEAQQHHLRAHYGFGPHSEQRIEDGALTVLNTQAAAA